MSYDDEFGDDSMNQPLDENIRKQLRDTEKLRKELAATQAALEAERQEANFARAGIPDSALGSLFRKGYDGDKSVDAIRKAAQDLGILTPEPVTPQVPDPSEEELAALKRTQGATVGTSGQFPDSSMEYFELLSQAKSVDDVMKIVESDLGTRLGLHSSRLAQ